MNAAELSAALVNIAAISLKLERELHSRPLSYKLRPVYEYYYKNDKLTLDSFNSLCRHGNEFV